MQHRQCQNTQIYVYSHIYGQTHVTSSCSGQLFMAAAFGEGKKVGVAQESDRVIGPLTRFCLACLGFCFMAYAPAGQ